MGHLASILNQATGLLFQAMTLLELADKNAPDEPDNAGHRVAAKKGSSKMPPNNSPRQPKATPRSTTRAPPVQGLRASIPVPVEDDPYHSHNGGTLTKGVNTPCNRQGTPHQRRKFRQGRREHMFSVGPIGWWMRMWWGAQYFTPVYA